MITRREQSNGSGPVPPHRYGLPSWPRAYAIALVAAELGFAGMPVWLPAEYSTTTAAPSTTHFFTAGSSPSRRAGVMQVPGVLQDGVSVGHLSPLADQAERHAAAARVLGTGRLQQPVQPLPGGGALAGKQLPGVARSGPEHADG